MNKKKLMTINVVNASIDITSAPNQVRIPGCIRVKRKEERNHSKGLTIKKIIFLFIFLFFFTDKVEIRLTER